MRKGPIMPAKPPQWIAIGAFAEATPLVAAVTDLASVGVPLAGPCVMGTLTSMKRAAAAPEVRSYPPLAALMRRVVEVRLPGSEATILAAPSNPVSLLSPVIADGLRAPILDGHILLAVPAATAGDAARVGRILLRYSSRHVHVHRCPHE